jgi:hypothetical protein
MAGSFMTLTQRIFALTVSILFMLLVLHLIRRGKLDIAYSVVWFATGMSILALVVFYDLLIFVGKLIGAKVPTTSLFLFAILFLIIFGLQISVQLTRHANAVKALTQQLAMVEHKLDQLRRPAKTDEAESREPEDSFDAQDQ